MSKKLTILLMRYPGTFPKLMCFLTRFGYTHSSIGLEEDLNTFYSFVKTGFIVEKITRYEKPDRKPFPCALYEIDVPRVVYEKVKQTLSGYEARKKELSYTNASMLLSLLLHIPYRQKNRYFCSHFVAEVLQRCRAANLPRSSILYLPKDFHKLKETRMIYQGDLRDMAKRFRLAENT